MTLQEVLDILQKTQDSTIDFCVSIAPQLPSKEDYILYGEIKRVLNNKDQKATWINLEYRANDAQLRYLKTFFKNE